MKPYINDLLELINHGKVSNTYKMSWIKSIVEICEQHLLVKKIHFDELSPIIFSQVLLEPNFLIYIRAIIKKETKNNPICR